MEQILNVAVAGAAGAFGRQHLDALTGAQGVRVTYLIDEHTTALNALATRFPDTTVAASLDTALRDASLDAIILATPTPLHATQAIACLSAGKAVLVEIPMADNLRDAETLVQTQRDTGLVAMAGHTRRFNPGHRWLHSRLRAGDLSLHHLEVHTRFLRRDNRNALGEPRSWTDHLLWHHACHTVDLFHYQTAAEPVAMQALQGPLHPELGIAMDMSIGLKSPKGALCSLALSFNNDGPLGSEFRYICNQGTYIAHYDALTNGHGETIDLSGLPGSANGLEEEQREFFAAIRENRAPNASVEDCLPAMRTLHELEHAMR